MTTIKPFANRILIKPVDRPSGPLENDSNLNEYGEVIAIGPDVIQIDSVPRIKVGDKVGFSVFGIEKLVIDEQKYYFLQDSPEFLLCIIED